MTCPSCQTGETVPATATKTLERGETLVVVRHVPVEACDQCSAPIYSGAVVDQLLALLEAAHQSGVAFEVREYAAADVKVAS